MDITKSLHCLTAQEDNLPRNNSDVYWTRKSSIKKEIIEMSIKNQVLSKEATFIWIVKENTSNEIGGVKKIKEIAPQAISIDYKPKLDIPQHKMPLLI